VTPGLPDAALPPPLRVEAVLKDVPGVRRVLRTELDGIPCVTRVLTFVRVDVALGPQVEQMARFGRGSLVGVSEELMLTLEGYRVATRLPHPDPRWPEVMAAGVTPDGYAYITTRWVEGTPLHHLAPLPHPERRALAVAILDILAELHDRHVVHGDLKPENLVRADDGWVGIIDLDTLREVGGARMWAPTRDITRSWAAPEQERQRRTFLASDLWAWSRIVRDLFPEGPPPEWKDALDACRQADPLRRPRTGDLLRALRDGAGDLVDWLDRPTEPGLAVAETAPGTATERVPEAAFPARGDATERVPETTPDTFGTGPGTGPATGPAILPSLPPVAPSLPPAAPLARPRRRRVPSCLTIAAAIVLSPFIFCAGGWLWWDHSNVVEADGKADEALAALKAHKTRRELNTKAQRSTVRALAEDAWKTRHTKRSGAVRALAVVWSQGWQDSGATWDRDRFEEGEDAVAAVEDSRQPEALLALGTLYGAACRLHHDDATAAVHCQRALDALTSFQERLPEGSEQDWLRVEGAWTEVLVRWELASEAMDAGLPDATKQLEAARDRCTDAEPWLPYAPVNGPELLQDCLHVAGVLEDLPAYLRWSDRLLADDRADGSVDRGNLKHLYTAAGRGCEDVTFEYSRRLGMVVKGPDWCLAVGDLARHCYGAADMDIARGSMDTPGRDWDRLRAVLSGRADDGDCVK
jgi:hypothetical protein